MILDDDTGLASGQSGRRSALGGLDIRTAADDRLLADPGLRTKITNAPQAYRQAFGVSTAIGICRSTFAW
jgi:hypothetical protein